MNCSTFKHIRETIGYLWKKIKKDFYFCYPVIHSFISTSYVPGIVLGIDGPKCTRCSYPYGAISDGGRWGEIGS